MMLAGCKSQKETVKVRKLGLKKNLPSLMKQIESNEFDTEWLSIKMNVAFKTEKMSDSFKMYVRLKKDSLMWISATYYKVEAMRLLISQDSVKLLDRREKKFYTGDFKVLNNRFDTDFNFETLQGLILGNGTSLIEGSKVKLATDNTHYMLSTVKKYKKVETVRIPEIESELTRKKKNDEESVLPKSFNMQYRLYYNPETYRMEKLSVQETKNNQSFFVKYNEFEEVAGQAFPKELKLNLVTNVIRSMKINYLRVEAEKELNFSFKIPDKYEKVLY